MKRRRREPVWRGALREEPVQPGALPVLLGVPAAGAVDGGPQPVREGGQLPVRPVTHAPAGPHPQPPAPGLQLGHRVVEPLRHRHRRGVHGAGGVRAGEAAAAARQAGEALQALGRRPCQPGGAGQRTGAQQPAAAKVGAVRPLRAAQHVPQRQRQGGERGDNVDLHGGHRPERPQQPGRVPEPGRQCDHHQPSEPEPHDPAPPRRPPRQRAAHDHRLPRPQQQQGEAGRGVHAGHPPGPAGADPEGEPSRTERQQQAAEQAQVGAPAGARAAQAAHLRPRLVVGPSGGGRRGRSGRPPHPRAATAAPRCDRTAPA